MFGVLFSGVTGIMAGANMSGELVSPARAIPKGTLAACAFTLSIFLLMSLLTAVTSNPELLLHDCMYLQKFALWKPVVTVGVVLATFSASLNNLIGASRSGAGKRDSQISPNFASKLGRAARSALGPQFKQHFSNVFDFYCTIVLLTIFKVKFLR